VIVVGALPDVPTLDLQLDGVIVTATPTVPGLAGGRLAVLSRDDLRDILKVLPQTTTTQPEPAAAELDSLDVSRVVVDQLPPPTTGTTLRPVRLTVLGVPRLAAHDETISTGLRRGSLAVMAILAAHPQGCAIGDIAASLHPGVDRPTAAKRVRTDINAVRIRLREVTGFHGRGIFVIHDAATGRYHLDPDLIEVDLWQMLTAIDRANQSTDDEAACLTALREAVSWYGGEFADGDERAWAADYATTYRHQILAVYARIAEILEPDQPEQAIAALEQAIDYDPINEELYQRLIRIYGRQSQPDAVHHTLRLLENRLADLVGAEPSEATRALVARQLKPASARPRQEIR
jgi:DNA-binding SARP family transcriptional activator